MKENVPKWLLAVSALAFLAAGAALAQEVPPASGAAVQRPPATASAATPAPAAPQEAPPSPESDARAPDSGPRTLSQPESAPEDGLECYASQSEITELREPQFGGGSVFDLVYSQDGMDVFSDVLSLGDDILIAGGSYTKDTKDSVYRPLLVKYDERMKPLWEMRGETDGMRTIHRMIATKDGITVLGDIGDAQKGGGIYIASYDYDGKVRGKPIPVFESGGDLDAKGFVQAADGSGYIIAAQFVSDRDEREQHGMLYKISRAGGVVWKRSYKTGRSTVFNSINAAIDGQSYIVAGQVVLEGNLSGGWLLLVDGNGAIKWQRSYPRGLAASLQAAAQTKDGEFVLGGKARPSDYTGDGLAAWVMKTDSTGNPLWQRFFRGDYSYGAPDLIVYEDGRASVLVTGQGLDGARPSHARLMTFSPKGSLLHLEDFTEGQNAVAHRLVSGAQGERILAGHAQTSFGERQESNKASSAPVYTYDAWILAGVPLDSYDDPCLPRSALSPILD